MTKFSIRFVWSKDLKGFDLVKDQNHLPRLIRKGGKLEDYEPLQIETLYAIFAKVTNERDLLKFVETHGPLTKAGLLLSPSKTPKVKIARGRKIEITELYAGEDVSEDLESAEWFRRTINEINDTQALERRFTMRSKPLRISDTRLMADRNGLRIEFRPDSLFEALRLQLAVAVIGGERLSHCRLCFKPFLAGAGTDKRADAQFCSDAHKVLFNSRKRKS